MNTSTDPTTDKILALMQIAAESLVGESCMVHFRQPIVKEASGEAYRDSRGVLSIDLRQELAEDPQKLLCTFLHEVGHLFLGHIREGEQRDPDIERLFMECGPLIELGDESKMHEDDPQEIEAENFAISLSSMVTAQAKSMFGETGIETCLRLLTNTTFLRPEDKSHD